MLPPNRLMLLRCIPCLAGCLYLALPTRNYNGDGLALIQRLGQTVWWENFDPNHFAWMLLVECAAKLGRALGVAHDGLTTIWWLQGCNAIVGALAIWRVGLFAKRLELSPVACALAQGFVASAFAFWHFTTDIDMYIVTLLFSLLGLEAVWQERIAPRGWMGLLPGALWLSAALLIHQIAILSAGTAIWWLWPSNRKAPGAFKPIMQLLGMGTLVVGIPYVVVAEWAYRDTVFGGLGNYLFGEYSGGASTDWGPLKYRGNVIAWLHAILLGHWHLMASVDHPLVYDSFRRPLQTAWSAGALGWLLPAGWAMLTWKLLQWLRREATEAADQVPRMLLQWMLPSLVFTLFLNPAMMYYRLIYLTALALTLGYLWDRRPATHRWLTGALVGLIAWNLTLSILPGSLMGDVPNYAQALAWREEITDRDLVITTRRKNIFFIQYLRAINGAHRIVTTNAWLLPPPEGVTREAFQAMDAAHLTKWYRRIYLDGELTDQLVAEGVVKFDVRVLPDYTSRTIALSKADWQIARVPLQGEHNGELLYQLQPLGVH